MKSMTFFLKVANYGVLALYSPCFPRGQVREPKSLHLTLSGHIFLREFSGLTNQPVSKRSNFGPI